MRSTGWQLGASALKKLVRRPHAGLMKPRRAVSSGFCCSFWAECLLSLTEEGCAKMFATPLGDQFRGRTFHGLLHRFDGHLAYEGADRQYEAGKTAARVLLFQLLE